MLISHKYKFIFLKSMKTASSSVFSFFTPYCISPEALKFFDYANNYKSIGGFTDPTEYGIVGREKKHLKPFDHPLHVHAKYVRDYVNSLNPNMWNEYFKFTTVRNPWDLCVSRYFFHVNFYVEKIKFNKFIKNMHQLNNISYPFYRINGKYVCDFYIRYEQLKEDIAKACDIVGITDYNFDNLISKHSNYRPKNLHYSEMYNKETKNLVADLYADDIKKFDYKFEEA